MLTREKVLAMKTGRELDALMAEKVMGFRCVVDKGNGNVSWIAYGVYGETHTPPMAWKKWNYKVPPYSTDIAAAWEVVEKMMQEYDVSLWSDRNGKWACEINYVIVDDCDTAHEAICKAALLAVMDGEDEHERD